MKKKLIKAIVFYLLANVFFVVKQFVTMILDKKQYDWISNVVILFLIIAFYNLILWAFALTKHVETKLK